MAASHNFLICLFMGCSYYRKKAQRLGWTAEGSTDCSDTTYFLLGYKVAVFLLSLWLQPHLSSSHDSHSCTEVTIIFSKTRVQSQLMHSRNKKTAHKVDALAIHTPICGLQKQPGTKSNAILGKSNHESQMHGNKPLHQHSSSSHQHDKTVITSPNS